MDTYYIYLKCYEASGYFTGIKQNSLSQEVCVHPYKSRAYKFTSKDQAYATARTLKNKFSCIYSYSIIK